MIRVVCKNIIDIFGKITNFGAKECVVLGRVKKQTTMYTLNAASWWFEFSGLSGYEKFNEQKNDQPTLPELQQAKDDKAKTSDNVTDPEGELYRVKKIIKRDSWVLSLPYYGQHATSVFIW